MPLSQCESCYVMTADTCSETVTLAVGLTPATEYVIWMQDKFNTTYNQIITSDGSGSLVLDLSAVDLAFTPYSGSYELSVSTSYYTNTTEQLTIATVNYNCINLSFYNKN